MSYSFRKKIRRPKTAEEFFQGTTPETHYRDDSYTQEPLSSSSEDEVSTSPHVKEMERYRGPVVGYNPNLPPAAFPTIDCRSQQKDAQEAQAISGSGASSRVGGAQPGQNFTQRDTVFHTYSQYQTPHETQPQSNIPVIESHHNRAGRRRQILKRQSKKWEKESIRWSSKLNTNRTVDLGMVTSEEDEGLAMKSSQAARLVPRWNDLTDAHKLNLLDTMPLIRPRLEGQDEGDYIDRIMINLRLKGHEREKAKELMWNRQYRMDTERRALRIAQRAAHNRLMHENTGRPVNAGSCWAIVDDDLSSLIRSDNYQFSTRAEEVTARAYWSSCGFDPKLLDGDWAPPAINSAPAALRETTFEASLSTTPLLSNPQQPSHKMSLKSAKLIPMATPTAPLSPTREGHGERSKAEHPPPLCARSESSGSGTSSKVNVSNAGRRNSSPAGKSRTQPPNVSRRCQTAGVTNQTAHTHIHPRSSSGKTLDHGSDTNTRTHPSFLRPLPSRQPSAQPSAIKCSPFSQADQLNASFRQVYVPRVIQPVPSTIPTPAVGPESARSGLNPTPASQVSVLLPNPVIKSPEMHIQTKVLGNGQTGDKLDLNELKAAVSTQRECIAVQLIPEKRPADLKGESEDPSPKKNVGSDSTAAGLGMGCKEPPTTSESSMGLERGKKIGKRGRPRKQSNTPGSSIAIRR
ncbi:MAG: hypothetical protein Q9163_002978 [Psora crenata]